MSLWGWDVTGAWAVVALAVEARWVVGSCVVSLGLVVTSTPLSRAVRLVSTSATSAGSPASGFSPAAGRTAVEAASVSTLVGSGAVGVVVRSHTSFQGEEVCRDKVMSGKAPTGSERGGVRVGRSPGVNQARQVHAMRRLGPESPQGESAKAEL